MYLLFKKEFTVKSTQFRFTKFKKIIFSTIKYYMFIDSNSSLQKFARINRSASLSRTMSL